MLQNALSWSLLTPTWLQNLLPEPRQKPFSSVTLRHWMERGFGILLINLSVPVASASLACQPCATLDYRLWHHMAPWRIEYTGAPMTSQREGPNEGHHYQYVGPYRIEKTLGKGQTGKSVLLSARGWASPHVMRRLPPSPFTYGLVVLQYQRCFPDWQWYIQFRLTVHLSKQDAKTIFSLWCDTE